MRNRISKIFDYLTNNIFLLFFIVVAVFPKINLINLNGLSLGIRMEDLMIFLYVIVFVIKLINRDNKVLNNNRFLILCSIFGVYILMCLVSTIFGTINGYISFFTGMLFWLRKLEYFIFVFIGYEYFSRSKNKNNAINKLFKIINYIIVFHFIICLLQYYGLLGSFINNTYSSSLVQGRVCSTFKGAYELSAYLLLLSPIYLYKIFVKKIDIIQSVFYLFMITVMIFLSESRTSLGVFVIIFVIALISMLKFTNKKFINKKNVIKTTIVGVSIIFSINLFADLPSLIDNSRFKSISIYEMGEAIKYSWNEKDFDYYLETGRKYKPSAMYNDENGNLVMAVKSDPSFFIRVSHWGQLMDGFLRSPLIGTGMSISSSAADGNYIRIIAESGIIGSCLWLCLQIYIFKSLKNRNLISYALRLGMISLFLGAIFIDVFEASKVISTFYFMYGVALGISFIGVGEKKKVRNAIIVNDFNYVEGGASKIALETASLMSTEIENVYLFCAVFDENRQEDNIKYVTTKQEECIKTKNKILGSVNGIYNLKSKFVFQKFLSKLDPNETVIHIHGWTKALSSSIFDAADYMGFDVALTTHDYFSACPNGGYFNYKTNKICTYKGLTFKCVTCNCDSRNVYYKAYRVVRFFVQNYIVQITKKCNKVFFISKLNKEVLQNNFKNTNSYLVRNPIGFKKRSTRVCVENNSKYAFIGRVCKEKGVELFCEIIRELELTGIVIGNGPELNRLKLNYPEIEFVGWKNESEIEEILLDVRALIFSSLWYEGAPLVPLECMSMGIPSIIANCSSAREYIINDNGCVFDPFIKNDIKDKIDLLNRNIREYSKNAFISFDSLTNNDYLLNIKTILLSDYKKGNLDE